MRYVHHVLIGGLLVLLGLMSACSPSNINSSSSGTVVTGGGGASTPSKIAVSLTDILTGATVTAIPSSGSVNVHATVTDSQNNLISGVTVSFAVNYTSAGSFNNTSATTNSSGVATVLFNANAVNMIVTITASFTNASGTTVNAAATLTIGTPPPPVPAGLTLSVSPLSINILGQAAITVTALDSGGNAAYNTVVNLSTSPTTTPLGSFSPTSSVTATTVTTNSAGQATATFYAGGTSGTAQITASITSVTPNIVKTASVNISSQPNSINLTAVPSTVINSATSNITADVLNVLNQPVSDGTVVTFSCLAGNCSVGTYPGTATTVNGLAQITFTASATAIGSIVLQASAGMATADVTITVNAATTSSIAFVSASPNIIPVGSGTSTVTFEVLDSNGNPQPNVSVTFQLYGPTGAYLGGTAGSLTDTQSSNSSGDVITTLHAGPVAGPVRIVASTTVSGTLITASSGSISIGGGIPSASHFSMAAKTHNIAGIGCLGAQDTVSVFLADRFGNYNILQGTSVSFFSSAGAIDTSNVTDATGQTSVTLRSQAPWPTDVAPLPGEPFWTEVISGQTYTHNPRDGWVGITAITTGEEAFFDTNANGIYDSGEPYTDIGEPYVDINRTFSYSTGDLFFDWPSYVSDTGGVFSEPNGIYDAGNGVWDAKIPIFQQTYIVFTGPPHVGPYTSRIEDSQGGTTISLSPNQSEIFYVYLSDINMNPLVSGTSISPGITPSGGSVQVLGSSSLSDMISMAGPAVIPIQLTDTNTTGSPITVSLTVMITWPGAAVCNDGTTVLLTYPYTITLN